MKRHACLTIQDLVPISSFRFTNRTTILTVWILCSTTFRGEYHFVRGNSLVLFRNFISGSTLGKWKIPIRSAV